MKYLALLLIGAIGFNSEATESLGTTATVNSLIKTIEANYVQTEKVASINAQLLQLASDEDLTDFHHPAELATFLTAQLKVFDTHFAVQYQGKNSEKTEDSVKEGWFATLQRSNFGFNKVEILSGNVGYIDFWGFDAVTDESRATVKGLMQFVAHSDALIIDLRRNGGGDPQMVQLISSYFLPKKTHLNSFYSRATGALTEFWTFDSIEQMFGSDFPLYILISNKTFSAAEEFSYNFKQLKRATIIGQSSKGGANPWQWFELGDGFRAAIPVSMAVNPISKTNWEGVGVIPDINVASESALTHAYIQALTLLAKRKTNPYQLVEINQKLTELTTEKP